MPFKDRKNLSVLFLTLDPDNDDFKAIRAYEQAHDFQFTALRSSKKDLKELTSKFNYYYQKQPDTSGKKQFNHPGFIYFLSRKGYVKRIYFKKFLWKILKDDFYKELQNNGQ